MKMTFILFFSMAILCRIGHTHEVKPNEAIKFISSFYKAIEKHDLATVDRMIDDRAIVKVLWKQANPPQTFSLSKADYLQQMKATWRFASNEQYKIENINADIINGVTVVTLKEKQERILFGKKTGQNNEIKFSMISHNNKLQIHAINSQTQLW